MLMTRENVHEIAQSSENFVVFRLNRIHYAVAIEAIQQIIEMVTITPVLRTEEWLEGVINYHGASIPVVNLRRLFRMEVVPYRWHTPIILVNLGDHMVGLIVDEVLDVTTISIQQIVSPQVVIPPGVPETPLLKGIIQADNKIILLLDLTHLFDRIQVQTLATATEALGSELEQNLVEKVKKSIARKQAVQEKQEAERIVAAPNTTASKKKGKTSQVENSKPTTKKAKEQ